MCDRQLDEERILHVARAITDDQARNEYLDQICAGDLGLRKRLEALLEAPEKEESLPASENALAETADHAPIRETEGQRVGRYKLMEQIGEGGMGTVFVAQQDKPIRRRVALKVIKPGMDSKAVIARFEAERQALAMMDHPNIAKVLDAGTTESGRPFFAMELVKGVSITHYCDRNRLTIKKRLELFIPVCQAIQHAHQKGIIHRDIKPSNVLLTLHDGKPVPKVIDFGVAKALNTRLTNKTIYTEHRQVVGTLLYMSPEQAELSGLDIDTRSDIYSLGVLLYELLTGTTPFQKEELEQAGFDEQRRIIRDKEPPKASIRVSSLGEAATVVADHRKTDVRNLGQEIKGDLDWITIKALEKDRTRRYPSAESLAIEIERFLCDQPVTARPPSNWYLLQKVVKRHRVAFYWLSAIFVLFVVSSIVTGSLAVWAWSENVQAGKALESKNKALALAEKSQKESVSERKRAETRGYELTSELAFSALDESNRGLLLSLIKRMDAYDGDKGFEYHALKEQARRIEVPEIKVGEKISSILFEPHTDKLIVGSIDGKVSRFDSISRKKVRIPFHVSGSHIVVSPNGKYLAAVGTKQPLRVVETDTNSEIKLPFTGVKSVAIQFSNTDCLACISLDGTIHYVKLGDGEIGKPRIKKNLFGKSHAAFQHLAISESGKYVAAGIGSETFVWDPTRPDICEVLPTVDSWYTFVLFGPENTLLAGNERSLVKFQIVDGKLVKIPTKTLGLSSTCAALSPDGKTLAIGCADYQVWVGTFDELEELGRLPHSNYLTTLCFSNDGQTLATGGRDGKILLWKKKNWNQSNAWSTSRSHEPPLAIDQLNEKVYTAYYDRSSKRYSVRETDLKNLEQISVLSLAESSEPITALAVSTTGDLAVATNDGSIQVWPKRTRFASPQFEWKAHTRRESIANKVTTYTVSDLQFSLDGQYVYSSGQKPGLAKWRLDWKDGSKVELQYRLLDNESIWVSDLIVDETGERLIVAGGVEPRSGFTKIYPLEDSLEPIRSFEHREWCRQIALSRDGKFLLCEEDFSAGWFKRINLETGAERNFRGHSSKSRALAYHPSGNRFVTGSDDRTIKIWNVHSKSENSIGTLRVDEKIRRLEFVDSETLISISWDGNARVWNAPR